MRRAVILIVSLVGCAPSIQPSVDPAAFHRSPFARRTPSQPTARLRSLPCACTKEGGLPASASSSPEIEKYLTENHGPLLAKTLVLSPATSHRIDLRLSFYDAAAMAAAGDAIEEGIPKERKALVSARLQWLSSLRGESATSPVEARRDLEEAYDDARERLVAGGAKAARPYFDDEVEAAIAPDLDDYAKPLTVGPLTLDVVRPFVRAKLFTLASEQVADRARLAAERAFDERSFLLSNVLAKP